MSRLAALLAAVALVAACGSTTPTAPTTVPATSASSSPARSPSPPPSPSPAPSLVAVAGVVRDATTGRGIPNARVEVIGGADDGRATSTDATGAYRLDNLRDSARRLMASAPDYAGQSFDVTGTTVNFDLMRVLQFAYSGTVQTGVR
jgi:hypothetical protein